MTVHSGGTAVGAILLDIEGTTTPIAFVYGVLFPFARRNLRAYLSEHRDAAPLAEVIGRLREEWTQDIAGGESPPPWPDSPDAQLSSVEAYVEWLMDRDRKSPGLKRLQGYIWEGGYRSGLLKSEIFPDVAPAIRRWLSAGVKVAIYSSGSVLAQRLLFAHTPDGDLTPCFSGFFDTGVGSKTSSDSYHRIAAALQCPPARLLFVSDAASELAAASEAGCRVLLCVRPGNPPQSPAIAVDVINSLDQIS